MKEEEYEKKVNDDIWWLPVGAQMRVVVYEYSKEPVHVKITKFEGGWFASNGAKYNQDGSIVGKSVNLWEWEFKSLLNNPLSPLMVTPEPKETPEKPEPSKFVLFVSWVLMVGGLIGLGVYLWKLCKPLFE